MSNPWRGPLMPSLGSTPGGDSILITSAPKSANCFTQVGPARTRDRSRIRRRDRAGEAVIFGMQEYSSGRRCLAEDLTEENRKMKRTTTWLLAAAAALTLAACAN